MLVYGSTRCSDDKDIFVEYIRVMNSDMLYMILYTIFTAK